MLYRLLLLILFSCFSIFTFSQLKDHNYDSVLAKKVGADEYGMKTYVMALLRSGNVTIKDSAERSRVQLAHLKNIQRLAAEGKLIVAGPFLDDQHLRGIFIFNVSTVEEAKALAASDPAIKAGVLTVELHPWYGSAALVETIRIHQSIQKKSFTD